MGRGVETIRGAEVIYLHFDAVDEYDWDIFRDEILDQAQDCFRSLERLPISRWIGYPYRETVVLAENGLAKLTLSEYCGCVAVSLVPLSLDPKTVSHSSSYPLQAQWCAVARDTLEARLYQAGFQVLGKLGTMSNGVGVFQIKGGNHEGTD